MENQEQPDWQYVGFMLDGELQHILATDSRFAAILLSEPVMVDLTDEPNRSALSQGATYDEATQGYIPVKVYASWVWNDEVKDWRPPVEIPTGVTETTAWAWSEEEVNWISVPHDAANVLFVTHVE
jgi:hypothetical protein